MAKVKKTNAMRILDQLKLEYSIYEYNSKDGKIDGISVAEKIDKPVDQVYKTLVAQGTSKNYYVFVLPVNSELSLKKAASVSGEKKIEMIPVKDIMKITGYIRGGCSPLGMKKSYKTFIALEAERLGLMIFSAGKIGVQIEMTPGDLKGAVVGEFVEITG